MKTDPAAPHVEGQIDTGDVVYHAPSKERWVVAYVEGERLSWCGWPPGNAYLADCTLVKKATDSEKMALLAQMAEMHSDDPRKRYAQRILKELAEVRP